MNDGIGACRSFSLRLFAESGNCGKISTIYVEKVQRDCL
jgi:hypothetical protein